MCLYKWQSAFCAFPFATTWGKFAKSETSVYENARVTFTKKCERCRQSARWNRRFVLRAERRLRNIHHRKGLLCAVTFCVLRVEQSGPLPPVIHWLLLLLLLFLRGSCGGVEEPVAFVWMSAAEMERDCRAHWAAYSVPPWWWWIVQFRRTFTSVTSASSFRVRALEMGPVTKNTDGLKRSGLFPRRRRWTSGRILIL